jgi:hypothetical protein
MTRVLAITGVPGVGKSTCMLNVIAALGGQDRRSRYGLLDYAVCRNVAVLGVYDDSSPFGGTDKLAMNVQQHAEDFVRQVDANAVPLVDAIAFEGDRLCGSKFLTLCRARADTRIVVLETDSALLKDRRDLRSFEVGKEQDATWLRGRESKVAGVIAEFAAERRTVNTLAENTTLAGELAAWLRYETTVEIPQPVKTLRLF